MPQPTDTSILIRSIEEHAFKAVPATKNRTYDGWLIRLSDGRTRRTNSVNFLDKGVLPCDEKLNFCETLFAEENLPVCFRMTPLADPSDFAAHLAARGYQTGGHTDVLVQDTADIAVSEMPEAIELESHLSEEWLSAHARIKDLSSEQRDGLQKTLSMVELPTCFASLRKDGEIISIGLGVLSESHIGLFDFMTDPAHLRRGYAAIIANKLLEEAKIRGVRQAYLQVVRDNEGGRKFWSALGFSSSLYSYYYLTKTKALQSAFF